MAEREWIEKDIVWVREGTYDTMAEAQNVAEDCQAEGYSAYVTKVPDEFRTDPYWKDAKTCVVYRTKARKLAKDLLSLAGEFAVASELCRRGIYAQLTLATRKRTDLLVDNDKTMLRIQVKAKQGSVWPLIKGVYGDDIVLILVDYENKNLIERPDFYVLTSVDWENFVSKDEWIAEQVAAGRFKLDDKNVPIGIDEEGKDRWKGRNIYPSNIFEHKEQWGKIEALLNKKE